MRSFLLCLSRKSQIEMRSIIFLLTQVVLKHRNDSCIKVFFQLPYSERSYEICGVSTMFHVRWLGLFAISVSIWSSLTSKRSLSSKSKCLLLNRGNHFRTVISAMTPSPQTAHILFTAYKAHFSFFSGNKRASHFLLFTLLIWKYLNSWTSVI